MRLVPPPIGLIAEASAVIRVGAPVVVEPSAVAWEASLLTVEASIAISESPCCYTREELRIETGKVWRGYVYAAGAPHFCGMEEYEVPNLILKTKRPELSFVLGGQERTVAK